MNIEIWTDYMCPFCYIGKRNLERALSQFAHRDKVKVIHRSFELDPHAQRNTQANMYEWLAQKYNLSLERAKEMSAGVAGYAEKSGLHYQFDTMVPTNTFDAHRLTHFAAQLGKAEELAEILFKSVFMDGLAIGERDVLVELASEAGLDQEAVASALAGDDFAREVRMDQEQGSKLGISGVPFFLLDQQYSVSGAQPVEVLLEIMNEVWDKKKAETAVKAEDREKDAVCGIDSCSVSDSPSEN